MSGAHFRVISDDHGLVVIDKPAGWLVHRSVVDWNEHRYVLQALRDQLGGQHLYPLHRLDKPTSGLLVFARDKSLATALASAWPNHRKAYIALCRGWLTQPVVVDKPLVPVADKLLKHKDQAQSATTEFYPLAQTQLPFAVGRYASARYSLQACVLRSGRRHQIRRHAAHLRYPIIGDVNYGDGKHNAFMANWSGARQLWLRAMALQLQHPDFSQPLSYYAQLPLSWQQLCTRFSWSLEHIQQEVQHVIA